MFEKKNHRNVKHAFYVQYTVSMNFAIVGINKPEWANAQELLQPVHIS